MERYMALVAILLFPYNRWYHFIFLNLGCVGCRGGKVQIERLPKKCKQQQNLGFEMSPD